MRKTGLNCILFLLVFASVFCSCSKNSAKPAETFIVSADTLMDITGEDWNDVELQLMNKVVYGYTEVPEDQSSDIKASISLPVIDTSIGQVNCTLLLNVDSATNKVVKVYMQTADSLPKFDRNEAYALMLHYCNGIMNTITDTTNIQSDSSSAFGSYATVDGKQVMTTIDDILSKLNNGYESNMLSIRVYFGKKDLSLVLFKDSERRYRVSFDSNASL